jgi:hypothetical protein
VHLASCFTQNVSNQGGGKKKNNNVEIKNDMFWLKTKQ